ncbi:hypothetical protein [Nocardioides sp.]|uniref:hypothetical protein n=1 Tax=Nocardioides sp. TaxID=35761 RepID=UPI0032190EBB
MVSPRQGRPGPGATCGAGTAGLASIMPDRARKVAMTAPGDSHVVGREARGPAAGGRPGGAVVLRSCPAMAVPE